MIVVTPASPPPVVVEEPNLPQPRASVGAPAFRFTLTGGDGSTWDLNEGPVGLLPAPVGLGMAPVTHRWRESPAFDGARWGGSRTTSRPVTLPVEVEAADWQTWRDTDAALFRALHPSRECLLTATSPDAVSRTLALRFVAGGEMEDDDPLLYGRAVYALEFIAPSPFWMGESVAYEFGAATSGSFFPGPPFTLTKSATLDRARVTNPGDEPVWPTYEIIGPATTWSVGVGSSLIASSTAVRAGQTITVNSEPSQLTVTDNTGADLYTTLVRDTFAPIPAGANVSLNLNITGFGPTSSVRVSFTPLHRRFG